MNILVNDKPLFFWLQKYRKMQKALQRIQELRRHRTFLKKRRLAISRRQ